MYALTFTTTIIAAAFSLLGQNCSAQNIPDPNFADAIRAVCPLCIDNNNNLTPVAQNVDTLDVTYSSISSLAGIEGFAGLQMLDCSDNDMVVLPILPANLKTLNCSSNELTALSSLPSNLTYLFCTNNELTGLPVLPVTLLRLDCVWNDISVLPALPGGLKYLSCGSNQIDSLPALPSHLEALYCADNQLHEIPLLPPGLTRLVCYFNQIAHLPPLPPTLTTLSCSYNSALQCLPPLPGGLQHLYTLDTQIDCLPNAVAGLSMEPYLELCTEPCNSSVSASDISAAQPFTLQPNPVSDILQVHFSADYDTNADIRLLDSNGQTVRSLSARGDVEIPVGDLPQGIYRLEVRSAGRAMGEKILIIQGR